VPEIVPPNPAPDYTGDLRAILNTNPAPQVLYVVAYPPEGVQLIKNFETAKGANPGWASIQLLFSEGVFEQKDFLNVLRNSPNNYNISGYLGTAPSAYGGVTGPNYAGWARKYNTTWHMAPGLFDDGYYDAAYLLALAAQAAGSATGAAIKSKIVAMANPPGVKIYPGMWREAVENLSKGNDIDYEGASGAVNVNGFGDPLSGYVVWGVRPSTGLAYNKEIFPEALVVSLARAPPAPAPPAPGTRSVFLQDVVARPDDV
jgi:hypothetical protein